ncbi:MAG: hypothetical protein QOD07_1147 [Frankiaceae bacterium]|jgi:Na+-driven multidrug efflux pump|nr:hypothetical protein [Frankiaceae bacterium]
MLPQVVSIVQLARRTASAAGMIPVAAGVAMAAVAAAVLGAERHGEGRDEVAP